MSITVHVRVIAGVMASTELHNLSLSELNEKGLLEQLQQRYLKDTVYTDVGDILIAINPFQQLPIYGPEWSGRYGESNHDGLPPHIYRVAAAAFTSLIQSKKDQVCVISGESGAGKTESTKFIIQQVSCGDHYDVMDEPLH